MFSICGFNQENATDVPSNPHDFCKGQLPNVGFSLRLGRPPAREQQPVNGFVFSLRVQKPHQILLEKSTKRPLIIQYVEMLDYWSSSLSKNMDIFYNYVFFTGNDFSSVSSGNHWKLLEYQHQKHVFWNSESPNAMSGQFGIQLVVSIRLGISRILRRSFAVAKNCSIVYLLNGELPLSNC